MNKKPSKFPPEVRERAVRLVREQRSEHPSMWMAAFPLEFVPSRSWDHACGRSTHLM